MKTKWLYFHPHPSSFIKTDSDLLEKHYTLKVHWFRNYSGIKIILSFLSQFLFLCRNNPRTRGYICFFAGYSSYLPVLFGKLLSKPCIIIVGGTESHNYASINYGSLRKPIYRWVTLYSLRNASHICPVHKSLVECTDTYYGVDYPKQGFKYFAPDIKTPITEIHNGYDYTKFYSIEPESRVTNSFITVATNFLGGQFYLKGADLILEAAKALPQFSFTIIGKTSNDFPKLPNLHIIPFVKNEELLKYLSAHEFYLQLSIAEGFPNALCEAMLCGCIPIGSDVYAIPMIIENSGFILKRRNIKMLIQLLEQAVNSDKKILSKIAQQRIKKEFSINLREQRLKEVIDKQTYQMVNYPDKQFWNIDYT